MGIERIGRHPAGAHLGHHLGEIVGLGIAAGDQRGLALVKFGSEKLIFWRTTDKST